MSAHEKQPHELKLIAADRRAQIAEIIDENSSISIADIIKLFNVSAVTARADLTALEEEGKVARTYGGAVSKNLSRTVAEPKIRMAVHQPEKEAIAKAAAELVHDGDSIALDTGTTTYEMLKYLHDLKDLTLLTNDFSVAEYIERHCPSIELVFLGGIFRRGHRYTYGQFTSACLEMVHLDKVFLATNSFLSNQGFMTEFEPVAAVKSHLISHSKQAYVLMDASKVGASSYIRFATINQITGIIMDKDPEGQVAAAIDKCHAATKLNVLQQ